ncbi:hypothetical protein ACFYXS_31695 [Streptomyces sp. NPDC002574]|uniref:hypothetical protein n=1 Tax=Streptomyces sp. NPDC002574 TaxID=3364652 RepID=UPI00369E10F7
MVLICAEAVEQARPGPVWVRVRSQVGSVVALWKGAPADLGRRHHVEWTVDEGIAWAVNTWPASVTAPGLSNEDERIVLRGRLLLTVDGAALLDLGAVSILFDLADPPPPRGADGAWVEVRVARDSVSLYPYHL